MGRYVSEAWFGRQFARHPPAYQGARNGSARPLAGPAPSLRHDQPELTRPAGMALIITGTVLMLAVPITLPFLNVKLADLTCSSPG